MSRALLPRQERFITAYYGPANGIGWRAAQLAGYKGDEHTLRSTSTELLTNPVVQAALAAQAAAIEQEGVANRQARVAEQHDRWQALMTIRRERAANPDLAGIDGGVTGFIVHQRRGIGSGDDFEIVDEYKFDKALFDAFREIEQQTAKELGQTIDRGVQLSVTPAQLRDMSDAELDDLAARLGGGGTRTPPQGTSG